MKSKLEKLLKMDRRIIFLFTAIIILAPIIKPLGLPGVKQTPTVKAVYDTIESLPEGAPVLLSFDFDPGSKPELYPMAMSVCRHLFRKNVRVIGMNLWAAGTGLADEILTATAKEYGREYGKDYVFLGFQEGKQAVITQLGSDIYSVYPRDQKGKELRAKPVMHGIKSLKDFAFMVNFTAGYPGIDEWIPYGSDKYGFKIAAGSTAVNETTVRPYVQSKQIVGAITAMKGAAEYESLMGKLDKASAGMEAVGLAQFLIIFLILLSNGIILLLKRQKN